MPVENLELREEIHEFRLPGTAFGVLPLTGVLGVFASFFSGGLSGALREVVDAGAGLPFASFDILTADWEALSAEGGSDNFFGALRSAFESTCPLGFSWTVEAAAFVRKI